MTATIERRAGESHLDPVTFEVLKNAFTTSVDLMSAQILRTCHSFVIYARDFSCALVDAKVPAELHVYERGGHGYGLRRREQAPGTADWPHRLVDWLGGRGFTRP